MLVKKDKLIFSQAEAELGDEGEQEGEDGEGWTWLVPLADDHGAMPGADDDSCQKGRDKG